jgi:hypothetical protein
MGAWRGDSPGNMPVHKKLTINKIIILLSFKSKKSSHFLGNCKEMRTKTLK